jgi:hypothetical protein
MSENMNKPEWFELAEGDNSSAQVKKVNKKLPAVAVLITGAVIAAGAFFANASEPNANASQNSGAQTLPAASSPSASASASPSTSSSTPSGIASPGAGGMQDPSKGGAPGDDGDGPRDGRHHFGGGDDGDGFGHHDD